MKESEGLGSYLWLGYFKEDVTCLIEVERQMVMSDLIKQLLITIIAPHNSIILETIFTLKLCGPRKRKFKIRNPWLKFNSVK